jgi:hypothetical protein
VVGTVKVTWTPHEPVWRCCILREGCVWGVEGGCPLVDHHCIASHPPPPEKELPLGLCL